ncbi:MAG: hypothetical protein ACFFF9_10260 [Candidatus Thorarchaeota archaeon]
MRMSGVRRMGHSCILLFGVLILTCFVPLHTAHAIESPEFPIGLNLKYEAYQQFGASTGNLRAYDYFVNGWITKDSIISLQITDDDGTEEAEVTLPEWYAVDSVGADFGPLHPLWMNVSHWSRNGNVTIPGEGICEIISASRNIETEAGDFTCWVARKDYSSDSAHYHFYYYDIHYGVLIKRVCSQWGDGSSSASTRELVECNLDSYDPIYGVLPIAPLEILIIFGIAIEIAIIGVLYWKRLQVRGI